MITILSIVSLILTIAFIYTLICLKRSKTSNNLPQDLVVQKAFEDVSSIQYKEIEEILKSSFETEGFAISRKIQKTQDIETVLFDAVGFLHDKFEEQTMIRVIHKLEEVLKYLETISQSENNDLCKSGKYVMSLLENNLNITRITFSEEQFVKSLQDNLLWKQPAESGAINITVRYSPWKYKNSIIIKGIFEQRS